jgi:hypothetical protein
MSALQLVLAPLALFLAVGVLLFDSDRRTPGETPSPRIHPSDLVQEHYVTYGKRLQAYYESLITALKVNAPDLLPLLESPKPPQHGYQILPQIVADSSSPEEPPRTRTVHYSWPWTDKLIETGVDEIVRSEAEIRRAAALGSSWRKTVYEKLARSYSEIRARQQGIDAHIQYNHLWQTAIAANRSAYDRETALHDAVLERQAVLEALEAANSAGFKKAAARLKRIDLSATPAEMKNFLVEREKLLSHQINEATDRLSTPEFIRVENHGPQLNILRVPFYTDIDNPDFVTSVKETIEKIWRIRDGDNEFRVEVPVSFVSAAQLYGTRQPPRKGDQVSVDQHLGLFPADRAILTTGAMTTHVYNRAIILGPHDITPRVLAHEFGHILGFRDMYFRGYKDLGSRGFQVMEVVAEPRDIMGAPTSGSVLLKHFERILRRNKENLARRFNSLG